MAISRAMSLRASLQCQHVYSVVALISKTITAVCFGNIYNLVESLENVIGKMLNL